MTPAMFIIVITGIVAPQIEKYNFAVDAIAKYGGRVNDVPDNYLYPEELTVRIISFWKSDLTDTHFLSLTDYIATIFEFADPKFRKRVELQFTKVTGKGFSALKATGLTELSLASTLVYDEGLGELAQLDRLEVLFLDHTYLTLENLEKFVKEYNNRHETRELSVSLVGAKVVDPRIEVYVGGLKTPKPVAGKDLIGAFRGLKGLIELDLGRTGLKQGDLEPLTWTDFRTLNALDLSDNELSNKDLEQLEQQFSKQLIWLELSRNKKIDDDGMVHVAKFTKLIGLFLNGTEITNAGLLNIGRLPDLIWLDLSDTKTSHGVGPQYVKQFPKIEKLYIKNTLVSNKDLDSIGSLRNLKELDVSGTIATQCGLENFLKTIHDTQRAPYLWSQSPVFYILVFENTDTKDGITLKTLGGLWLRLWLGERSPPPLQPNRSPPPKSLSR